jgi:hypothetical protein
MRVWAMLYAWIASIAQRVARDLSSPAKDLLGPFGEAQP